MGFHLMVSLFSFVIVIYIYIKSSLKSDDFSYSQTISTLEHQLLLVISKKAKNLFSTTLIHEINFYLLSTIVLVSFCSKLPPSLIEFLQ